MVVKVDICLLKVKNKTYLDLRTEFTVKKMPFFPSFLMFQGITLEKLQLLYWLYNFFSFCLAGRGSYKNSQGVYTFSFLPFPTPSHLQRFHQRPVSQGAATLSYIEYNITWTNKPPDYSAQKKALSMWLCK